MADEARPLGASFLVHPFLTCSGRPPPPNRHPRPTKARRIGEMDNVFFCSCDTWIGPRSTSFFSCVKLIHPMAKPAIATMISTIPTMVAAFM
jgi:hypothetical protein